MGTPHRAANPNALMLTRITDRLTFLYLDKCRIERDDNGVHALIETRNTPDQPDGYTRHTTYLPTATLTALILGPGTSITNPAAAACFSHGCGITLTGAGTVRSYGTFNSPYAPTHLLERQATLWANPETRTTTARKALLLRFPDIPDPDLHTLTIDQLRGLEGARMKAIYRTNAQRYRLTGWHRNRGDLGPLDPVNEALNYANTALYGLTNAIIQTLGLSPGLGFIHTGNRISFTLDIADIYKTRHVIPLAFSLHKSTDPGADAMRHLRENLRLTRLLPQIVEDIHTLLNFTAHDPDDDWDANTLHLWAETGLRAAGLNYHREYIDAPTHP